MALLNIDLSGYDPDDCGFAPIPPGDYEVMIVNSRIKEGLAAEFEFVVLGPVCRGVKLRDSFTFGEDPSMCKMKTMAVAARCPNPDFIGDSEELHGLRCRARVERKGTPTSGGCRNVISGYLGSFARSSAPMPEQPRGRFFPSEA